MRPDINSAEWAVFFKALDRRLLRTWEEYVIYTRIFGEPYSDYLARHDLKLV